MKEEDLHFSNSIIEELSRGKIPAPSLGLGAIISGLGIALSLYHLFFGYYPQPDQTAFRTTHLSAILVLAFLMFPLGRKSWREPLNRFFGVDLLLILLTLGIQVYVLYDLKAYQLRVMGPTQADTGVGTVGILLVLEAARRAVGVPMVVVTLSILLHTMLAGHLSGWLSGTPVEWADYVMNIFMETHGIYGIPIQVMATYIMLFMIFGSILLRTGIGQFFMSLAYGLVGGSPGGPAKAAVVSSGIMGTVSGSAVSNVVVTGSFTIPLMKRMGYRPPFAGAVEAVASTGGQIMPPIMGAAAFILAVIMGTSYWNVVLAAAIPGVLYYLSLFFMVDFEAKKIGLVGMPRSELPGVGAILKKQGHLLIPLGVIVAVLASGRPASIAGWWAIVAAVAVSMVRQETRMTFPRFLGALEEGGTTAVSVSVACAAAGIIIGSVGLSGLGLKLTSIMIDLSHGHLILVLLFTAVSALILGMGLTTSAVYITVATLLVPGMIKLGVNPMAAHLFAFYFGCLSAITPPVALAAYAASGIAGGSPMQTGWTATRIGLASYIVPFMFAYSPELVMVGNWWHILLAFTTATVGIYCLAGSVQGWFLGCRAHPPVRFFLLAASLSLIMPGALSDLLGLGFIGAAAGWRTVINRQPIAVREKRAQEKSLDTAR